jgi:hypothetical protein
MAKIITVSNRKGGVAKTTSCVPLGCGLALKGKNVLLVDMDPKGHIAPALGLEQGSGLFDLLAGGASLRDIQRMARPNLKLVPGNPRTGTTQTVLLSESAGDDALKDTLIRYRNGYMDYIILDTAPSVGRLQEMALMPVGCFWAAWYLPLSWVRGCLELGLQLKWRKHGPSEDHLDLGVVCGEGQRFGSDASYPDRTCLDSDTLRRRESAIHLSPKGGTFSGGPCSSR